MEHILCTEYQDALCVFLLPLHVRNEPSERLVDLVTLCVHHVVAALHRRKVLEQGNRDKYTIKRTKSTICIHRMFEVLGETIILWHWGFSWRLVMVSLRICAVAVAVIAT